MTTATARPRLLAFFAEPLVDRAGRPSPALALADEREELAAWLEDADLELALAPGTLDDLEKSH